MNTLFQDFRYAVRTLRKSPGFSAVAVLTLALGIGANSAIFSVVNAILLRPLPYAEPERLVLLSHVYASMNDFRASVSVAGYLDYQEQNQVFDRMTAIAFRPVNLTARGEPERLVRNAVSHEFFSTLGVPPVLGRGFLPEDDDSDRNNVVVLSHGLWQRRFGADPEVLGQTILLDGEAHDVLGVMPAGFEFPPRAELWTPIGFTPTERDPNRRGHEFLSVVARVKPGVTVDQARADMDRISSIVQPEFYAFDEGWHIGVESLQENRVQQEKPVLVILLAAVGFVLLIACANVANLLLARANVRRKEIAVRAALGATRRRIVRQLLTESTVLSLFGGMAGLLVAMWAVGAIPLLAPPTLLRFGEINLDAPVLAFTFGVSLLTGVLFGVVPAVQVSRTDLHDTLKEGGRGSSGGRRGTRRALVVAEVALALVLLISAALLIRSFMRVLAIDPGFRPERTMTFQLALPNTTYPERSQWRVFYQRALERLQALPGVQAAGGVSALPLSGANANSSFAIEGIPIVENEAAPHGDPRATTPGYFAAMGIPLLRGRYLNDLDHAEVRPVVVIDQEMVRRYFRDEDPIGRRLAFFFDSTPEEPNWREIIGVVRNVKHGGLDVEPRMQIYYPHAQTPVSTMYLAVRTSADPTGVFSAIRAAIHAEDPELPLFGVSTMAQRVSTSLGPRRFSMLLLMGFAAVALVMAAIGIYGVMTQSVAERSQEIGIRMALGAGRREVLTMILSQGCLLTVVGVGVGLGAALGVTRMLSTMLFGVTATDPMTFAAIPIVLTAVALLAVLVPAYRATRVDPMTALREE